MRGAKPLAWVFLLLAIGLGCLRSPQELAREHKERAEAYLEAGKLKEASVEYQAALQSTPADGEVLFGLANVLDLLGSHEECIGTLRRAIAADPGHKESHLRLGKISLGVGNYSEVLALARQATTIDPGDSEAIRLQAEALTALGKPEQARIYWQELLASPGAHTTDFQSAATLEVSAGEHHRAGEILRDGLGKFPRSGLLHAELGGILFTEDPEEARVLFERAEALAPGEARVCLSRARTLIRHGLMEEGLRLVAEAQREQTDPTREADLAMERGRLLLEVDRPQEAQTVLEEARERHPEHPGLAVTLADALVLQGRTGKARELVRFAAAFDRSGRAEKLLEGRIYLQEGFPRWAVQVTEERIAQGDQSVETRLLHARALSQSENWAGALREYRALLAQAPGREEGRTEYAALLLALGDYSGASAQLGALSPSHAETPRLSYLRAKILLGEGNIAGARRIAARLTSEQSGNPVALTLLGDVERAAENHDEALALYAEAQGIAPRAVEPLFAQTETMKAQGASLNQIIRVLEDHISARRENPLVLNQIATYLLESGDLDRASRRVQRSLMVEPNYERTMILSARIHMVEGNAAKAMVQLEDAIRLNPRSPEAYNWLAEIYQTRGEIERAEKTYRRLLDVTPGEPQTCNNLANLSLEQGRFPEAVTLAREALEGAPGNPAILDTLGWALELAGSSDEAAPYLKAAQERLPNQPEVLFHWGANLKSRGQANQAKTVLRRVLDEAPQAPFAARAKELLAEYLPQAQR